MIVRINGKIVEWAKELHALETPQEIPNVSVFDVITQADVVKEYIDFSTPATHVQSVMNLLESKAYHLMSQHDFTEYMYRVNQWNANEFLSVFNLNF